MAAVRAGAVMGAIVAALACDPPPGARGEPPAVVEAAPVEPEPAQARAPAVATTSAKSTAPAASAATPAEATAPEVRAWTDIEFDRDLTAKERVRGAKARKTDEVRTLFADAGVGFPPGQLLFRVFKRERELEVWASQSTRGPLTHVTTYSVCAASGRAGPKTREGDWQVPEGFYKIDVFNPHSRYHLSMRVDYPNERDRSLRSTGGQIMIHGDCASIGCVALGDERIEELWVIAGALRRGRPHVFLFPGRDLDALISEAGDPELGRFWEGLRAVDEAFAADHAIPRVAWDDRGIYRPKG